MVLCIAGRNGFCQYHIDKIFDFFYNNNFNIRWIAGVVKLVDALDSKSSGPRVRVGSIPTSGTSKIKPLHVSNTSNTSTTFSGRTTNGVHCLSGVPSLRVCHLL